MTSGARVNPDIGYRDTNDELPDVSIILVSYNTAHLLPRLFESLHAAQGPLRSQIIVVDNASRDDSMQVLRNFHVELIANAENIGFGRANNQALPHVRGRYVLLLNTDAFLGSETLVATITHMDAHPEIGVLGVKLVSENGAPQPSCRFFPTPWNLFVNSAGLRRVFARTRLVDDPAWDPSVEQECDWVPGCYYLIRREVVDRVGLFDPRYFMYYEEVDHCRSVKAAGWRVMYFPQTEVIHLGGESAASVGPLVNSTRQLSTVQVESELLYFRKHYGFMGLLSHIFLRAVAELMSAGKGACKGAGKASARAMWQNISALYAVLWGTHFGTRPTR